MAYALPQKIRNLTPYQPITGEYDLRLDANESCLVPSNDIMQRIIRRISVLPLNRYPDPYATECCKLAAKRFGVNPEQIVAGNGSDELICLLQSCLMAHGDCLATFENDFSMYSFYSSLAQLKHVSIKKNPDFSINVPLTLKVLNESNVDVLMFSNPCNPTSLLLPHHEVEQLLSGTQALVVVDEAYMEFAGDSVLDLVDRYPNLLVLKTCSKALGLAGARMGFAIGSKEIIQAFKAAKSPYNVNVLSQAVCAEILSDSDYLDACIHDLCAYRDALYHDMLSLQAQFPQWIKMLCPTKTNFVYFHTPLAQTIFHCLAQEGIAIRLMGDALRISTGLPSENARLLAALESILKEA